MYNDNKVVIAAAIYPARIERQIHLAIEGKMLSSFFDAHTKVVYARLEQAKQFRNAPKILAKHYSKFFDLRSRLYYLQRRVETIKPKIYFPTKRIKNPEQVLPYANHFLLDEQTDPLAWAIVGDAYLAPAGAQVFAYPDLTEYAIEPDAYYLDSYYTAKRPTPQQERDITHTAEYLYLLSALLESAGNRKNFQWLATPVNNFNMSRWQI